MEPEKFENSIKNVLQEREILPSANSWSKLEERLEQKRASKPYFLWVSTAAAVVIIFFLLGSYFNAPIASETPEIVEESSEKPILKEKTAEPEVLPIAASEIEEASEKPSAEIPVKNDIFNTPISKASKEEMAVALQTPSEATEAAEIEPLVNKLLMEDLKSELAAQDVSSEVSDHEIEALLLLATAELKEDPGFTLSSEELLHQVEYELDQSFRQKVFEVVKEGLLKAKTAVANRDF